MKKEQIQALEDLVASLGVSQAELKNWVDAREGKNELIQTGLKNCVNTHECKNGFIPTELLLVYRKGTEFTVENGLNLKRKEELWGIQLLCGVMVALMCGAGNNVLETTWEKVKKFAEKMRLNGKAGFLPSKDVLKNHWDGSEEAKFAATVEVLKENEIEADGYRGRIWCFEEYGLGYPYFFGLNSGCSVWTNKLTTGKNGRVAVAF